MIDTPEPGLLEVWSGSRPVTRVQWFGRGGILLGRDHVSGDDERISANHARVHRDGDRFIVEDLGSRNGTFVAGHGATPGMSIGSGQVIRTGRTLWVTLANVRPFDGVRAMHLEGVIVGGRTSVLWQALRQAVRDGRHVVLAGPRGSGRGRLARAFAELRGVPSADFEVDRVGLTVDTLICEQAATLDEATAALLVSAISARPTLRAALITGPLSASVAPSVERWRSEQAAILTVPPPRERPDELALLADDVTRKVAPGLSCHVTLIEQCLLFDLQFGELVVEVERAARRALAEGQTVVRASHLDVVRDPRMVQWRS